MNYANASGDNRLVGMPPNKQTKHCQRESTLVGMPQNKQLKNLRTRAKSDVVWRRNCTIEHGQEPVKFA